MINPIAVISLLAFTLTGCGTTYNTARQEERRVMSIAAQPVQLPSLPRGECIRQSILSTGANPARLVIAVDNMENYSVASPFSSGNVPQLQFHIHVRHALVNIGFTVPWNSQRAADKPIPLHTTSAMLRKSMI